MKPTQAEQAAFEKVKDRLEASLEVAVMFKEGMSRHDIYFDIRSGGWGASVVGYPSDDLDLIDNAIRFWMLLESSWRAKVFIRKPDCGDQRLCLVCWMRIRQEKRTFMAPKMQEGKR